MPPTPGPQRPRPQPPRAQQEQSREAGSEVPPVHRGGSMLSATCLPLLGDDEALLLGRGELAGLEPVLHHVQHLAQHGAARAARAAGPRAGQACVSWAGACLPSCPPGRELQGKGHIFPWAGRLQNMAASAKHPASCLEPASPALPCLPCPPHCSPITPAPSPPPPSACARTPAPAPSACWCREGTCPSPCAAAAPGGGRAERGGGGGTLHSGWAL